MSSFSIKYRSLNLCDLSDLAGTLLPYLNIPTGSNSNSNKLSIEYLSSPTSLSTSLNYSIINQYSTGTYTLANGIEGLVKYISLDNGKNSLQTIQTNRGSLNLIPNVFQNVQLIYATGIWNYVFTPENSPEWFTSQLQSTISVNDAIGNPGIGDSVSLSADGNILAIGGQNDNNSIGATWIFNRVVNSWTEIFKLIGNDYTGDNTINQGSSVSLSSDGSTLAIGGQNDSTGLGSTWIFNGGIQQGHKLVGNDYTGDNSSQGFSVSLSSDGNTLAVGGYQDSAGLGATWIFTRNNGTWTQQGNKLVGNDYTGSFPNQGNSVSLSADGNTLAVGGNRDDSIVGAVWIFTRNNGTWTQQGSKLVANDYSTPPHMGISVSLSADGNTVASGGTRDGINAGATWVFTRTNGIWTQQGSKLTNGILPEQGSSVCLSSNGNLLAVGGGEGNLPASLSIYKRVAGNWDIGTIIDNYSNDIPSVSMSANGNTLAIGLPDSFSNFGSVNVYK